ncbi:hybrid sensor histidine kinase/response regulator [Ideonella sp. BN130291]|uniref:hybrid sensor histidine kinase/response regulator n=1 Tax=Ideonella sp. BN130291 TaxID=3112940 RepID=UPI002E2536D0|nr:response regulator [Ideonella sp. BN130291]
MDPTDTDFRPIDRSQHELLIVDDDPASRYATSRLLRSAGFRTREAGTGIEGLEAAGEGVSAMVLDIHLPDIDGFELCRLLRSRPQTARLPVLHLTAAYVTDSDKVRGLDSGADAYLTHPVEPSVLVATVQALVRTRVAEDAMRRSEAKFRAIYAQAPSGLCLLDPEGRLVDANPAMLKLLGRTAEQVVGRPLSGFAAPEWAERVDRCARHVGPGTCTEEFPMLNGEGRTVHVEWTVSPQIEPGLSMGMANDVSARTLLEQQRQQLLDRERVARSAAERMNRMKDDLIAVLSHELRTPLNAIMGWTHVLQKRGAGEEVMRGLDAIERNGQMQARMISDILDMSRLNLGKMPLSLALVDPAEVVASAVNALRPAMDERHNQLVLELAPAYRPIKVDSARLQQVIWNLVSNAIKFSPEGGQIRVALKEEAGGVRLTVADQGQGIAPEFVALVFDRFSQSDAAGNKYRGGLGLGLSIVKHLVEAHGGSVSASSAGPGRGAVFEVLLPTEAKADAAEAPEAEPSKAREPDGALDGLSLLVVDDDAEAAAMLAMVLGDRGASVKAVHDVDAALAALDHAEPDVLISDIGMPGQDGYDLIREVRRLELAGARRLPAIALTSFARDQDQAQALAAGFDAHCAKPLRPLQLVNEIRRLAGMSAFRDSR